LKLRQKRRRKG
jgi:hypothetical protein